MKIFELCDGDDPLCFVGPGHVKPETFIRAIEQEISEHIYEYDKLAVKHRYYKKRKAEAGDYCDFYYEFSDEPKKGYVRCTYIDVDDVQW
jgi:hypothetical protein